MGVFDDLLRRWRNQAAKRAVGAVADRALRTVKAAGEEILGESEPEPEPEDRLGRADQIRAEAERRRVREAQGERIGERIRGLFSGGSDEG